jgi:hypothetical protein
MSLSAWEQDALNSIKNGLADSDPALVARLAMFTRLASAEDMPVREKIQAVKLGVARRRRRLYHRLGVGRAMLLLWLVTTLTLIAAAVASSHASNRASGPGTCAGSWGSLCGHAAGAPQAPGPIP